MRAIIRRSVLIAISATFSVMIIVKLSPMTVMIENMKVIIPLIFPNLSLNRKYKIDCKMLNSKIL